MKPVQKSNRFIAVVCSLFLAATGVAVFGESASAAPSTPVTVILQTAAKTMYTTVAVNVRSGPGSSYGKAGKLSAGTKVTVVQTASGWSAEQGRNVSWSKISSPVSGYIRSDLLSGSKASPTKTKACIKDGVCDFDPDRNVYDSIFSEYGRYTNSRGCWCNWSHCNACSGN